MARAISTGDKGAALRRIKRWHTLVWAVFAGCILAMPLASWRGAHGTAAWLGLLVFAEVLVLALNHWRCPLTRLAAKYTDDRRANFDIYLPLWLARNNQRIFGALYVLALGYALLAWLRDGT
ncbi:MAG TPA: hypothetical protein PK620_07980 [Denitromonas sp.]|uniref:hypothetical protein n=1 Tax=Denitromonas sp. TaxID=2734609 RepID=UPI001E0DC5F2|nr:hypothetical protein [Rhodocyclaceae bacterium]MCP5222875.1 hypothetical protein [Zoogloeaceae bacterium]HPR06683.1 hypothetical protein [Denitromonas sp.]HQU88503.1 hypothetical protein [Denitromonas sp.]HQV14840.1 hypothetical protein [Denitromonas sp.]